MIRDLTTEVFKINVLKCKLCECFGSHLLVFMVPPQPAILRKDKAFHKLMEQIGAPFFQFGIRQARDKESVSPLDKYSVPQSR